MPRSCFLALFAVTLLSSTATALETRQDVREGLGDYIRDFRSALVAVDRIRDDSASELCVDAEYADRLDSQGYNGLFAQMLLCEEAAGIHVFPDLDRAEQEFSVALDGLTRAAGPDGNRNGPLFCRGQQVDVDALDNAGLDGSAIVDIICNAGISVPEIDSSSSDLVSITTTLIPISSTASGSSFRTFSFSDATRTPDTKTVPLPDIPSAGPSSDSGSLGSAATGSVFIPVSFESPESSLPTQPSSSISLATATTSSTGLPPPTSTAASTSPISHIPAACSSSSPAENVTVIVVTTLVTVTVTPTSSPTTSPAVNGNADNTPTLPPLRFTLESRVIPAQPAITDSPSPTPTWTIGPPLSFSNPRLVNGTAVASGSGTAVGWSGQAECSESV